MFAIANFLKKRQAFVVFFITFLVYSPLLFNHYVGDDGFIIEKNTFYSSWKNIPRLFEKGYIINVDKIIFETKSRADLGTGSVSYRPVSNFTYFFDYCLFHARPFGSHLIDILIHCINAVLVYWIVQRIFSSSVLGVFAGLLFSLHPIQSEAVAVMSYRADVFTAMFVLISFYFWVKFADGGYVRRKYYYCSLVTCFLALFSKESAVMLPFVIPLFDQMLVESRPGLKQRTIHYFGLVAVLVFYLYIYFFIFPNVSLSFHWLGGTFVNHCLIMGEIWFNYVVNILMPWTVKMVPGLYCPPVPGMAVIMEMGGAFIALITSTVLLWRYYKKGAFFLLWYILFYIPVSNLIPIANPMACRFMYLPSIGLVIVLASFLHPFFKSDFLKKYSRHFSSLFHVALILICVTQTLLLNNDWKSSYSVGCAWIRDYPSFGFGYSLLGGLYYKAGYMEQAKPYLEKGVLLGDRQPRDVIKLAECYIRLGEIEDAKKVLKLNILHDPDYDAPYLYLGEIYYNQKQYSQAQVILEKALLLNPKEPVEYMYLMRVYLNLNKFESAKGLLKKAGSYLSVQNTLELHQVLEKSGQVT